MIYSEQLRSSSLLSAVLFEHKFRGLEHDVFLNRLITERNLFVGNVVSCASDEIVASLVVPVDQNPDSFLSNTIEAWFLQSCPYIECILVAKSTSLVGEIAEHVQKYLNLGSRLQISSVAEWTRDVRGQYLVFARPGDILHPSLTTILTMIAARTKIDVLAWNSQRYLDEVGRSIEFIRRPNLEVDTLRHVAYIGLNFAVRTTLAISYGSKLIDEVDRNECHLFHLWLASDSRFNWHTHPEYLSIASSRSLVRSQREIFESSEQDYRSVLCEVEEEFEFTETECEQQPYLLRPRKRPECISVIVPFKDRADLTLECLRSVFAQETTSELEVILVDNCSQPETLSALSQFVRENNKQNNVTLIHYEKPFNHSAQCNLGIKESRGDVVLLLNNDAVLLNNEMLEEMAAWSMCSGVGTVGCRIISSEDRLICAGIKARLNVGFDYNSAWEESKDIRFSQNVRECFANTFACAMVSKSILNRIGFLNAIEFPNGYNDIEFCLRARVGGLKHIYLGCYSTRHTPGTSRGKCDEMLQKILLRDRFSKELRDGLFQLAAETRTQDKIKSSLLRHLF